MKTKITKMLFAGAAFAAAALWAEGNEMAGEKRGERITVRDGLAFVTANINGRGPFRLLIDTGAAICVLTPEAAVKAGLVYDHRVILTTFNGDKTVVATWNNHVKIGQSGQLGVEIAVVALSQIRGLDAGTDGVLGQGFLAKSAYMIDYRKKKMWLGEEAAQIANRLPMSVPAIQIGERIALSIVLDPGTEPWLLVLDSGASDLLVRCSVRCPFASEVHSDGRLQTYLGARPISHGKLRHVEIAGVTMPPAEAVLVHAPSRVDDQTDGVLPTRWFSAIYVDSEVVRLSPAR